MAIIVNNSIRNNSPNADNYFYCQPNSSTPWASVTDAHAGIPSAYRGRGKRFLIMSDLEGVGEEDYWYHGGVDVINLVPVLPRVYIEGFASGSGTIDNPWIIGSSGPTLTTPSAPTAGVVNDSANTFNWTNNPSYTAVSDYEYSVNGSVYTNVTSKPITLSNLAVPVGQLKVRVKAVAGVSNASLPLANTVAFTVSVGVGTPVIGWTVANANRVTVTSNNLVAMSGVTDSTSALSPFRLASLASGSVTADGTANGTGNIYLNPGFQEDNAISGMYGIFQGSSGNILAIVNNIYTNANNSTNGDRTQVKIRMLADGVNINFQYSLDAGGTFTTFLTAPQVAQILYVKAVVNPLPTSVVNVVSTNLTSS